MAAASWPRLTDLPPFVIAGLLLTGPVAVADEAAPDAAYHYSTINALMRGLYDGDMTIGGLARHGDHGLGTVNGLDGELVIIDGASYQVRADGGVHRLQGSERTPFAVVARFEIDREVPLPASLDMSGLERLLDGEIGNANFFQAIRIEGAFPALSVRSVPRQTPPYRPLADVVKEEQSTFELKDARGTLIGFRSPDYAGGVTVPGYHFHFISDDRRHGGHLLGITTGAGTIKIDEMAAFEVELPRNAAFGALDLTGRGDAELDAVEKGRR
jgi:acetolactate decarboxylase